MTSLLLQALNTNQLPPTSFPFIFHIPPRTDLWRKPPSTFSASQPTFYVPIAVKDFKSATVKIKKLPYSELYDQAGLAFLWADKPDVWVKSGVEYYEQQLRRSTVAPGIGGWSDWSLGAPVDDGEDILVEAFREKEGASGLVIKVDGIIIREIQGFFTPATENDQIYVGVFGARPADVNGTLDVEIADFQVVLA